MNPTSGKQWRRGSLIQLPSGNVVSLRKVDPMMLVAAGDDIPNVLSNKVAAMIEGRETDTNIELNAATIKGLIPVFNMLCKSAFVNPSIVDVLDPNRDDQITIDDVDFTDKMFVYSWCFGGEGRTALTFPEPTKTDLGTVSDVQNVPSAAIGQSGAA